MDTRLMRLVFKMRRYKKLIALGIGASCMLVLLAVIGVFSLTKATYLWGSASNSTQNSADTAAENSSAVVQRWSATERALLWAASNYLQLNLEQQVISGKSLAVLNCVASIGGPSPSEVIESVKAKVDAPEVEKNLDALLERIKTNSAGPSSHQSSCISWFINT